MTETHPLTPPDELLEHWRVVGNLGNWQNALTLAYRAGADRARALLAQPVAEGPTDDEIEEWADACSEAPLEEMDPEVHGWRRCFTAKEFSETIRAALDRWGRSTPELVEVAPLDKLDRLIAFDRDNPTPEATNG